MDYQSDSSDEDSTESPLFLIRRCGNALHFEQPEGNPYYMSMRINGLPVVYMKDEIPQRALFRTATMLYHNKDDSWSASCKSSDLEICSDDNSNNGNAEHSGLVDNSPSGVELNPDQDNTNLEIIEVNLETIEDPPSVPSDRPLVDDILAGFNSDSSPFSAPSLSDLDLESSNSSTSLSENDLFSVFYPSLDPNNRLADPTKRAAYERKSSENTDTAAPSLPLEMQAPIWKGTISMKTYFTNVEMYVITGYVQLATVCLLNAADHTTIQINQKADIDEKYFENRYIKNDSRLTTLIALPSKVCRCCYNNLQPFQNFLVQKKMVGVVACKGIGDTGVTYLMQFFPKSDLTTRYTRRLDPLLTQRLTQESYLVIIIESL